MCTATTSGVWRTVPCLGVDEFAVCRGRTYATILVDMSTRRPVDVLADRTAHTFAAWLREHPEVWVACRAMHRSTNGSNAATACEPLPVNSISAAAPSCASPGPPMSANFSARQPTARAWSTTTGFTCITAGWRAAPTLPHSLGRSSNSVTAETSTPSAATCGPTAPGRS
ncbi:transposase [Streptomyces sp. BH-SS-21]|uniref:Transposase n=1 Tax=Streptomyces liliiviolaceus TaxID=2823109 RepID=A0A940XUK9_9ACTN|nr:transposase [Streptomyces liliiviolaceus]